MRIDYIELHAKAQRSWSPQVPGGKVVVCRNKFDGTTCGREFVPFNGLRICYGCDVRKRWDAILQKYHHESDLALQRLNV